MDHPGGNGQSARKDNKEREKNSSKRPIKRLDKHEKNTKQYMYTKEQLLKMESAGVVPEAWPPMEIVSLVESQESTQKRKEQAQTHSGNFQQKALSAQRGKKGGQKGQKQDLWDMPNRNKQATTLADQRKKFEDERQQFRALHASESQECEGESTATERQPERDLGGGEEESLESFVNNLFSPPTDRGAPKVQHSPNIFGNSTSRLSSVGQSESNSFGSTLFSFASGSTSIIDRLNISGFGAPVTDNRSDAAQQIDDINEYSGGDLVGGGFTAKLDQEQTPPTVEKLNNVPSVIPPPQEDNVGSSLAPTTPVTIQHLFAAAASSSSGVLGQSLPDRQHSQDAPQASGDLHEDSSTKLQVVSEQSSSKNSAPSSPATTVAIHPSSDNNCDNKESAEKTVAQSQTILLTPAALLRPVPKQVTRSASDDVGSQPKRKETIVNEMSPPPSPGDMIDIPDSKFKAHGRTPSPVPGFANDATLHSSLAPSGVSPKFDASFPAQSPINEFFIKNALPSPPVGVSNGHGSKSANMLHNPAPPPPPPPLPLANGYSHGHMHALTPQTIGVPHPHGMGMGIGMPYHRPMDGIGGGMGPGMAHMAPSGFGWPQPHLNMPPHPSVHHGMPVPMPSQARIHTRERQRATSSQGKGTPGKSQARTLIPVRAMLGRSAKKNAKKT